MRKLKISRQWFRSHAKLVSVVVIIVLLIGAAVATIRNLNAPAEGTINQVTNVADAEKTDPYANPSNYSGKYITFTYPAHYKKIPSQKSTNYLEVVNFYGTSQTSKQISVGVLKENLADDSGYNLRKKETNIYIQEPRNKTGVVVFSSTTNGSERTAFAPHQDKVATISITAPPGWDLTEDLATVLNSLKWK
jgi:hypothetical protein